MKNIEGGGNGGDRGWGNGDNSGWANRDNKTYSGLGDEKVVNFTRAEKGFFLIQAMQEGQPRPWDYRKAPGFSEETIRADMHDLAKKERWIDRHDSIESTDEFVAMSEPLVADTLGSPGIFRSRKHFAHLATDYDDKIGGTDVVFGVEEKKTHQWMVFSVDVASGTSPENVAGKFLSSEKTRERDDLTIPPYAASIHYCQYRDERWKALAVPHFILGLSPGGIARGVEHLSFNKDGLLLGSTPDFDTDFMLLSEMQEQIEMQTIALQALSDSVDVAKQRDMIKSLSPAVGRSMATLFGLTPEQVKEDPSKLQARYAAEVAKHADDKTYHEIIEFARKRKKQYRGKLAEMARLSQ